MGDPIKLWATRNGCYCWLTARDAQPPFLGSVFDGPTVISTLAFDDHNSAVESALAEMKRSIQTMPCIGDPVVPLLGPEKAGLDMNTLNRDKGSEADV